MTEDEMVGWYHRLNGHEFGQALGHSQVGSPQARVKTFPSNLCALPLQGLVMFLPGKRARNSFKAKSHMQQDAHACIRCQH